VLVAICPALKTEDAREEIMNGRIKTARRLGAEDKKPKPSGDCAREENRASYAVCFDKA
jgi:hypothetical protein